jgi:hypothetical protein
MQGQTLGQTADIYTDGRRYEDTGRLFGNAFQSNVTNNINVTTGATAQQIADAINRANRASGTNIIRR